MDGNHGAGSADHQLISDVWLRHQDYPDNRSGSASIDFSGSASVDFSGSASVDFSGSASVIFSGSTSVIFCNYGSQSDPDHRCNF
jgi:hypothetical protein